MDTFRIEIVPCFIPRIQLNCYSHIFIFYYWLNLCDKLTDAVMVFKNFIVKWNQKDQGIIHAI